MRKFLEEIRGARFREDLFYRLNVLRIHIPPLRERRKDIEPLLCFFLKELEQGWTKGELPKVLTD